MASPTLITPKPTTTTTTRLKSLLPQIKSKLTLPTTTIPTSTPDFRRRDLCSTAILFLSSTTATPLPALAAEDDEYVRETEDVINKVRTALTMDRTDPNVASAVAELRQVSNSWVAKYRREKSLLGRVSFRDMYSALNAVSGHYISFGPTAPIPTKRKARILEEMETAEKALQRGR